MNRIRVQLDISANEYLDYYRGRVRQVSAQCEDGRRIQFPAECLKPFVTHNGIRGRFEIVFTDHGKLHAIHRL